MKEFIEKAIEGGWKEGIDLKENYSWLHFEIGDWGTGYGADPYQQMLIDEILLQPSAWQAVGNVEGWKVGWYDRNIPGWHFNMLGMIDALCEGKTIEDYLSTLFKK